MSEQKRAGQEGFVRALARLMSAISEDRWRAGWMAGLEYNLWKAVQEEDAGWIAPDDLAALRRLSEATGGWIVWDDTEGEKFIPIDEWLAQYEEWLKLTGQTQGQLLPAEAGSLSLAPRPESRPRRSAG